VTLPLPALPALLLPPLLHPAASTVTTAVAAATASHLMCDLFFIALFPFCKMSRGYEAFNYG
jgi:nitrate reductase gamma subunit